MTGARDYSFWLTTKKNRIWKVVSTRVWMEIGWIRTGLGVSASVSSYPMFDCHRNRPANSAEHNTIRFYNVKKNLQLTTDDVISLWYRFEAQKLRYVRILHDFSFRLCVPCDAFTHSYRIIFARMFDHIICSLYLHTHKYLLRDSYEGGAAVAAFNCICNVGAEGA